MHRNQFTGVPIPSGVVHPFPTRRVLLTAFLGVALSLHAESAYAFRVFDFARVVDDFDRVPAGAGVYRWNSVPHFVDGVERSLDGGLRYSLQGGSYEAFRDRFQWSGSPPSVDDFQAAIAQAFSDWEAVDPATGLGTSLRFVPDLETPAVLESRVFANFPDVPFDDLIQLNRGAEIDLFAVPLDFRGEVTFFVDPHSDSVTLTSGVSNYPAVVASGADIRLASTLPWDLDQFQRVLSHEIGHALGLSDVDVDQFRIITEYYDDNLDVTNHETAAATLSNSFAALIDPLDPDSSAALLPFELCERTNPSDPYSCISLPGLDSPGVRIHMESNDSGRRPVGVQNDDFAARQFLYPFVANAPSFAGDYNGNGQVEQGDLDLVLLHWGGDTIPDAWTNNPPEGAVDQQELDAVLLNWGSGAPLGATSVPEPSALAMALWLLGAAYAIWSLRRRAKEV